MHVILVQPPATIAESSTMPPREPPVPPWDLVCLHSYLLSRTGHQCQLFDARVHPAWVAALEQQLPYDTRQVVFVVRARPFEWPAALQVLRAITTLAPGSLRVLCGPLPTDLSAACARCPVVDAVIAGDPELPLRALLENRYATSRLRQIPGLALRGDNATAVWAPDLDYLPPPAWDRLPWKSYTTHAQGGLRALMRLSRGHPGQPADRALGGASEPLRFIPMERLAATFGKCAHLGVVETLIVDPPGIWTADRLAAWCGRLLDLRNTHPWSLQMMPHLLSPEEGETLREAGCRRVELLLPTAREAELARYGVRGDARALRTVTRTLAAAGLEVLVRGWLGGPGEERGERDRWEALLRQLDFPPVRFQPFPLALDAPLMRELGTPSPLPDLASWVEHVDEQAAPVMAWGGAPGHQRAVASCAALTVYARESWAARWSRLWTRWRETSVIDQLEQRSSALLKTAALTATPETAPRR
jgi:hypothetical protein